MFDPITYVLLQKQIESATSTGNIKISADDNNALKRKTDGLYVEETEYETVDIDFQNDFFKGVN